MLENLDFSFSVLNKLKLFSTNIISGIGSLKRWYEDGTFEHLQARILAMPAAGYAYADDKGLINWNFGAVDGSFSPWQGRRCVARGGIRLGYSDSHADRG